MKYLISFAIILLLSSGGTGGFYAGKFWQQNKDQKDAIANKSGHYDPITASFGWGIYKDEHLAQLENAAKKAGAQ